MFQLSVAACQLCYKVNIVLYRISDVKEVINLVCETWSHGLLRFVDAVYSNA